MSRSSVVCYACSGFSWLNLLLKLIENMRTRSQHARKFYSNAKWNYCPLLYVCSMSRTHGTCSGSCVSLVRMRMSTCLNVLYARYNFNRCSITRQTAHFTGPSFVTAGMEYLVMSDMQQYYLCRSQMKDVADT